MRALTFVLPRRVLVGGWALLVLGCQVVTVDVAPRSDGSVPMPDGGSGCLDGVECARCGTSTTGCAVACTPRAACTVGLREGAPGTLSCGDGTSCAVAAGQLDFCAAESPECVVTTGAAMSSAACVRGRCTIRCDGPCEIDCPSGDCVVTCTATPCRIRSCPVPLTVCNTSVTACGRCE